MTSLDDLVPDPPRAGPTAHAADGVGLATWDLGGSGPPLLLVHAAGFHAWTWLACAATLRRTHRVWALDLRGHGGSDPGPGRSYRDWALFASDVSVALDAIGIDRPAVVGHSLGGASLLMAELARPGSFSSIYCYEPIVVPPWGFEGPDPQLAESARRRRSSFPSVDAAVQNFAGRAPLSALAPGVVEAYVAHGFTEAPDGAVTLRLPGPEEATVYEGAALTGLYDRLGGLDLPVTIAGGDVGAEGGPGGLVDHLAERIPHARAEHFATLGHFGPMEGPYEVAAAIVSAS